jgi:hypothetical protein
VINPSEPQINAKEETALGLAWPWSIYYIHTHTPAHALTHIILNNCFIFEIVNVGMLVCIHGQLRTKPKTKPQKLQ